MPTPAPATAVSAERMSGAAWILLLLCGGGCLVAGLMWPTPGTMPPGLRPLVLSAAFTGLAACPVVLFFTVHLSLIPAVQTLRWILRHGSLAGYDAHAADREQVALLRARTAAGRWTVGLRASARRRKIPAAPHT